MPFIQHFSLQGGQTAIGPGIWRSRTNSSGVRMTISRARPSPRSARSICNIKALLCAANSLTKKSASLTSSAFPRACEPKRIIRCGSNCSISASSRRYNFLGDHFFFPPTKTNLNSNLSKSLLLISASDDIRAELALRLQILMFSRRASRRQTHRLSSRAWKRSKRTRPLFGNCMIRIATCEISWRPRGLIWAAAKAP